MSTIMFKVRQGETEFVSGTQVTQAGNQPEVELVAHTAEAVRAERKIDVDIYMYNTGRLGAVRVFTCGDENRGSVKGVMPAPVPVIPSLRKLSGMRAISYCPAK
jgi:hypothetical protein